MRIKKNEKEKWEKKRWENKVKKKAGYKFFKKDEKKELKNALTFKLKKAPWLVDADLKDWSHWSYGNNVNVCFGH